MKLIPPRFDRAQILVVGDIMLDRYWHGGTFRISPEAPVPVVKVGRQEDRIGGAGNVALNIASLGAGASIVAVVGADEAADSLKTRLAAAGIHCDFQVSAVRPTITKMRVISRHQQLLRLDFEESFSASDVQELPTKVARLIEQMSVIVLSDYAKGVLREPAAFIQLAKKAGIPVLVDPKGIDFERYRGATLVTPNLQELEAVVGPLEHERELLDKGVELLRRFEFDALLVTRSEHGMTLIRKDHPELHFPARAREVFDVTGAGDTVVAVLAGAIGAGLDLPDAVALSNIAAGIIVGKLGTATVSMPELRRAVQAEPGSERGAVSEEQLLIAVEDARAHGERIVFTNGCFDIIHAGHVGYLEQAQKLGDRLIVAVNSDASVTRLKGAGRPINPCGRRMAVLAGLESVDWVVSFEDDTPERLLELIKPDVLVKGGDYQREEIVGWQIVEAYGGKVAALEFLDNCSTSAIVKKIQG